MSTTSIGATCTVLPNDPAAMEKLSGPSLARTMHKLCGAVRVLGGNDPAPTAKRTGHTHTP